MSALLLVCPGEGSSEGPKGVTQDLLTLSGSSTVMCTSMGLADSFPALFAGRPPGLAVHRALFLFLSPQVPSASPCTDSHLTTEPFLFPQALERSRYLCVQTCPGGIDGSLEKGDDGIGVPMPMFKPSGSSSSSLTPISMSAGEVQFALCPPQRLAPVLELIPLPSLCLPCSQDGVILWPHFKSQSLEISFYHSRQLVPSDLITFFILSLTVTLCFLQWLSIPMRTWMGGSLPFLGTWWFLAPSPRAGKLLAPAPETAKEQAE